jgi:hypothetical protein
MNSGFWLILLVIATLIGGIIGYNMGVGISQSEPGVGGSPGIFDEASATPRAASPTPEVTGPSVGEEELISPTPEPTP